MAGAGHAGPAFALCAGCADGVPAVAEPALPRMDRMAGPQLDDVRRALQSAYVERRGAGVLADRRAAYRALAQLLLQAPGYEMARKDQWERELCPGGKHYP